MKIPKASHGFPPLREKFRVPTRVDLLPALSELSKRIVNVCMPVSELIEITSFYISHAYRVHIMHSESSKCPPDMFIVTAEYDDTVDATGTPPIFLTLISHPSTKYYIWDESQFELFSRQVCDSIVRELAHMKQFRSRNFHVIHFKVPHDATEDDYERIFLSHPDEIDAYSYTIADELTDSDSFKKVFASPFDITKEESLILWNYNRIFENTIESPVLRRLLKKIYKRYRSKTA